MDEKDLGRLLKDCRMCGSISLYEFLDLGFTPPSDALLRKEHLNEHEIMFPLKIAQCQDCGLTQLIYAVNPKHLYNDKYLYEASITKTGKKHFFEMADSICQRENLQPGDLTVDLGSNVGVLLERFKNNGMETLGIEPAPRICDIANQRGIESWQEFMGEDVAKRIVSEKKKAKVISGTNVFAHIDDKSGLMKAIDTALDEEGIFVVEAPYLVDLLDNLEYDTIYLEHLEYLSVKPMFNFFKENNMDLFDVEKYDIHGSSVRYFMCRKGKRPISESVEQLIELENQKKVYCKQRLETFARDIYNHRTKLNNLLHELKHDGKKIVGISAPAKGTTLLNYCKIGPETLDYLTEKSIIKRGKYSPGMHIPIVGEERLAIDKPDYGLILAWNFGKEIMANNQEFQKNGGKFIIPIPEPRII